MIKREKTTAGKARSRNLVLFMALTHALTRESSAESKHCWALLRVA